ncbi:hypothetical protein HAX54_034295 [Datura stramonium]|uniref:Uncharacterized protein n=1 Tax=Datura stramonium TaxID=4076 RepID=A0ABS8VGY9_DATST|nr:hypothetical protein [Datura stramonium]
MEEIPSSICNSTSQLEVLYLRRNNLKGEILQCLGNINSLRVLSMSRNILSGDIPSSICNLTSLQILDFGRNNLIGAIPQCFGNMTGYLEVLDMHHNSLSGTLSATFGIGSSLRSLNLHGNELKGKIPRSLTNCKELQVLDLGDNQLKDRFPMWLGTLPVLQVLSLRSNKLHGPIRSSRNENIFPELRIIDLSCNAFSGNLPVSLLQHFKAMRTIDRAMKSPTYKGDTYYQVAITVATKGLEREIVRILYLYTTIDLSSNRFEGHIPSVLGDLIALAITAATKGLEREIVMMDYVDSQFRRSEMMIWVSRQILNRDDQENGFDFRNLRYVKHKKIVGGVKLVVPLLSFKFYFKSM